MTTKDILQKITDLTWITDPQGRLAVAIEKVRDYDKHPDMQKAQMDFTAEMYRFAESSRQCPTCKEVRFDMKLKPCGATMWCEVCEDSAKKRGEGRVSSFGRENDADPFPQELGGYPSHLPKLTMLEEMLISPIHVAMKCYILENGGYGYKGHVTNIEQDNSALVKATTLPWRVEEVPLFIARKNPNDDSPSGVKQFTARRHAMKDWLEFLQLHRPNDFGNIAIDQEELARYEEGGGTDAVGRIRGCSLDTDDDDDNDNEQATSEASNTPSNQHEMGPAQAGASGASAEEIPIGESFMPQPTGRQGTDDEIVRKILQERYGLVANNPQPWPATGQVLSDYNTVGLQSLAFPTLFPYGLGDVTKPDRHHTVTMTNMNKHLLNYAVQDEHQNWIYPFAKHPRWKYWAQNTAERHRVNGQQAVYLRQRNEDANMSEDDLRRIVEEGGEDFEKLIGRMHPYNANINGSNAYLYKKRGELETLIEEKGAPTIWFSFSMADNHWHDLHKALNPNSPPLTTEAQRAAFRRKTVRDQPHKVEEFFLHRMETLLKTFFAKHGLEADWHWLRLELQGRGAYHAHGCARLKGFPSMTTLGKLVLEGREAERELKTRDVLLDEDTTFEDWQTEGDVWQDGGASMEEDIGWDEVAAMQEDLDEDTVTELKRQLDAGLKAEGKIALVHGLILSTLHPTPPSDATVPARDSSTEFHPESGTPHPTSVDLRSLDPSDTDGDLLNAVQRHKHYEKYCQSKKKKSGAPKTPDEMNKCCRFGYCKEICETGRTHVRIVQTTTKQKDIVTRIELVTERNDRWVNSYMPAIMKVWRANMDVQLTIDIGKIVEYMTKYVTKSEATMTSGSKYLVNRVMKQQLDAGRPVHAVLRKAMGKVLGERLIQAQECCHLISGHPTVTCSHTFVAVNLLDDTDKLLLPAQQDQSNDDGGGDNNNNNSGSDAIARMSIVEAYGKRMNAGLWADRDLFNAVQHQLGDTTLNQFAQKHTIGTRGQFRNKIKCRPGKQVVKFTPKFSCDSQSANYPQYCKLALVRYKPWQDSPNQHWDGVTEPSDQLFTEKWDEFVTSLPPNQIPDCLAHALAKHRGAGGNRASNHLFDTEAAQGGGADAQHAEDNRQDWQLIAEDGQVGGAGPGDTLADDDIQWDNDYDWLHAPAPNLPPVVEQGRCPLDHLWNDLRSSTSPPPAVPTDDTTTTARNNNDGAGPAIELNDMQEYGRDLVQLLVDRKKKNSGESRCGILLGKGGTGKTATISAAQSLLRDDAVAGIVHGTTFGYYATTGKAASHLPGGCTLHSRKMGFALPVGREKFKPLSSTTRRRLFEHMKHMDVIVVDEFSMLRQKEIYYLDQRLREIFGCPNQPFGGLVVILIGDPGQLPPVLGNVIWETKAGRIEDDIKGHQIYMSQFQNVVELTQNCRVSSNDHQSAYFLEFLDRLHDGKQTEEDHKQVLKSSHGSISDQEWNQRFNEDEHDVTHLFCTNDAVNQYNLRRLKKLGNKIALIEAEHEGPKAKSMPSDKMRGLHPRLLLSDGAKVYLTTNICPWAGLVNGSTGTVVAMIYKEDTAPPPGLPECVVVDFGRDYKGPAFFEGEQHAGWVPIFPVEAEASTRARDGTNVSNTRTMLPLQLAWAWTIWKSQGQTILGKVIVHLSDQEREHGLTYTAYSRVRKFSDIGIMDGLTRMRFINAVRDQAKMKPRMKEEKRLQVLASVTKSTIDNWRTQQLNN